MTPIAAQARYAPLEARARVLRAIEECAGSSQRAATALSCSYRTLLRTIAADPELRAALATRWPLTWGATPAIQVARQECHTSQRRGPTRESR
jgi:hypothetical protein